MGAGRRPRHAGGWRGGELVRVDDIVASTSSGAGPFNWQESGGLSAGGYVYCASGWAPETCPKGTSVGLGRKWATAGCPWILGPTCSCLAKSPGAPF